MKQMVWMSLMALGVCLAGGGRAGAAEGPRPVVGVRFSILAREFVETLHSRRPELETLVARRMAELCAGELSYVDWRVLTNAPSTSDPTWVFQGSLISEGSTTFPPVFLVFEGLGPGASRRIQLREQLYAANFPDLPTQDEPRLRDDLLEKVRSVFVNTANIENVQGKFLVSMPVAQSFSAIPDRQRIVLPARWGDMLPGDGSQLSALYLVRQADGEPGRVKLLLTPSVPLRNQVSCKVTLFDDGFADKPPWHPSMPASLSNAIPNSMGVFMVRYVKDYNYTPTLEGGVVMDPIGTPSVGGAP